MSFCVNVQLYPIPRTEFQCEDKLWRPSLKYAFIVLTNINSEKLRKAINPHLHSLNIVYIVLIHIRSNIKLLIYTNIFKQPTESCIIFGNISHNENHVDSYSSQMTFSEQGNQLATFHKFLGNVFIFMYIKKKC